MDMKRKVVLFNANWGTRLKVTTIGLLVLAFGLSAYGMHLLSDEYNLYIFLGLFILPVGVVFYAASVSLIRLYVLRVDSVFITHPAKNIGIDLRGLESIEVDPDALTGTYIFTNPGLFSISGSSCRNKKLGNFSAYATDPAKAVVLRFKDRIPLVITPNEPEIFIQRVKEGQQMVKESRESV